MKGLLVKDLCLMRELKKLVLIIIAVSVFLTLGNSKDGGAGLNFVFGYIMILMGMTATMTISYDEANNGMAFLMTLPFTKKQYVLEKYLIGGITIAAGVLLGMILVGISAVLHPFTAGEWAAILWQGLIFVMIGVFFLSVSIPIQLKLGGEKGRVAVYMTVMLAVFGTVIGIKLMEQHNPALLRTVFEWIQNMMETFGMGILAGTGIASTALVILLTVCISLHIMEKKEF